LQDVLAKLAAGQDLTAEEAEAATRTILRGEATPAQIGAFLAALRCKGETVDEILGCARAMRAHAAVVRSRHPLLVDTCGTGGDRAGTFNISTTAAFVVAGAGLPVAKHGNRAASSRAGSADVLEALGVRIDLEPEAVARCLDELGIAFLFAPRHHAALRHAAGPRRELGFRTVFNLLGPLANPAGAQVQVVGVPDRRLLLPIATVLRRLGCRRAIVVHGTDGLDELTLTGPSLLVDTAALDATDQAAAATALPAGSGEGAEGSPGIFEIRPEDVGLPRAEPADLRGGSPEENAEITLAVLAGERGPRRDVVCLNAAAALVAGGIAPDLRTGVQLAQRAIDEGRARACLEALRRRTQELAAQA
jgi:anthranilate phosphoribosyltransferase